MAQHFGFWRGMNAEEHATKDGPRDRLVTVGEVADWIREQADQDVDEVMVDVLELASSLEAHFS